MHQLPTTEFSERTLRSEAEWQRAYVVLSFLSQAYIWAEGEKGLPEKVPAVLAVPWDKVAQRLGLPPIVTYAATALYNWALHNPSGPIDGENLYAVNTFTGTEDESWFFMVPILVEQAAVPGLKAILQTHTAMLDNDHSAVERWLGEVEGALQNMRVALERMYERCDPKTFYVKIRPFFAGLKGLEGLPDGILYEDVDSKPRKYIGASAAQSSAVHVFDIFLRAQHAGFDAEFLETMREYMPAKHRAFLEALSRQPSVREYVKRSGETGVVKSYNSAVQAFSDFRSDHVVLVTRYIVLQKPHSVNASLEAKGTGGTDFMKFLKKVRDDTKALLVTL